MKGAEKKQRLRLDAEERKLAVKEFYHEHANWLRPRSKAVVVSEPELIALGGRKDVILLGESRRQTRIIFGGEGETRLIFTPYRGAWMVALEGTPSREDQRRELAKSGRGLWNHDKKGPVIAFRAVDALLSCFESFKGLPSNKQQADEVQFAIIATLEALERDTKTKGHKHRGHKLQLAFELLDDPQWPNQIGELRDHALDLAVDLQRPPSKKELKDQFDPPERVGPSEFSTLLKAAGLSWLKRGKPDRCLW